MAMNNFGAPMGNTPPPAIQDNPVQRAVSAVKNKMAFFKKKKKKKSSGSKNWIAGAIKKPGALHAALGVPQGTKIPAGKMQAAAAGGGVNAKRARLAMTLSKMNGG